jgi:serine/threonine protein kinase
LQTRPSPNQPGPQPLVCAVCKRPSQTEGELFCPHDGAILIDPSELPNAKNDPLIGRRIESFAIVARLGEGGMGTVYRALQIGMDREVALKILRSDLAHDGKVVARFHQEARAAARLSHRNLATVYTSGSTSDGIYYIAMEHLAGPSLEQVIASAWQEQDGTRTYTLDRPRVVRLWCQIVAALAHAHRLGIVHRDLRRRSKSRRSLRFPSPRGTEAEWRAFPLTLSARQLRYKDSMYARTGSRPRNTSLRSSGTSTSGATARSLGSLGLGRMLRLDAE